MGRATLFAGAGAGIMAWGQVDSVAGMPCHGNRLLLPQRPETFGGLMNLDRSGRSLSSLHQTTGWQPQRRSDFRTAFAAPAAKPLISAGLINIKIDSHSKLFWQSLSNYSKTLTGKNIIIFTSNGHGHNNQETTLDLQQGLEKFQQNHPAISVQLLPLDSLEVRKNEAYFTIDDHLTPLGHKLIANEIVASLRTKADQ